MDLEHLTEDEIAYELFRGFRVEGNLEDKRASLHGIMLSEEEGHFLVPEPYQIPLKHKPTNCRIKISDSG